MQQTVVNLNDTTTFEVERTYPDNPQTVVYPNNSAACNFTDSVTVNFTNTLSPDFSTTEPDCYGECSGSATITQVNNGTTPYYYQWGAQANSQVTQTADSLCAGTYLVTVTDSNNCSVTDSVTITQPDEKITGNTVACKEAVIAYSSTCASSSSLNWQVEGGQIQQNNDTIIDVLWTQAGPGKVRLTTSDSAGNSLVVDSLQVAVFSPPEPTIVSDFKGSCKKPIRFDNLKPDEEFQQIAAGWSATLPESIILLPSTMAVPMNGLFTAPTPSLQAAMNCQ